MRDTDNDRLYSFELTEQLLSGSQVEAWKEIAAKTLTEGGDEAERKTLDPLKGNSSLGWNTEEMKVNFTGVTCALQARFKLNKDPTSAIRKCNLCSPGTI